MKTMIAITALMLLTGLAPTVIEYPVYPVYLGDFWPVEHVRFHSSTLRYGPSELVQEAWVFDLNATSDVTFAIASEDLLTPPENFSGGFFLVLYPDVATQCTEVGAFCNISLDATRLGAVRLPADTVAPRRVTLRVEDLAPGRYIFVLRGATNAADTSEYTGRLTVRR